MNPELSTYLNMLRVLAAVEVLLGHLCGWKPSCGIIDRLPYLAGDGVVTFFVLSGYVVSYTADTKDRTLWAFAINRCARIYSVMLPALVLTLVLGCIGLWQFPGSYNGAAYHYQIAKIWLYVPLWLSFSSQFWTLDEPILDNVPFWSLCFEVWFYVFFAVSLFMRGPARIVTMVVIALIVGPKICLLFPLWWLGVLTYRAQQKITLAPTMARALLILAISVYSLIRACNADIMASQAVNAAFGNLPKAYLHIAWELPGDFMIALCVAGGIIAMRFAALRYITRMTYPVGIAASFTFTLYLTHGPLLKFFVALDETIVASMLWPTMMTLAVVIALGLATERRIGPWRSAFALFFRSVDRMARSALTVARRNGA